MNKPYPVPPASSSGQWRHEYKYELTISELFQIRSRLQAVAKPDPHTGPNGRYRVRSLYFDNYTDQALWEKMSGTDPRAKFRIRFYNGDTRLIHLEKKIKKDGLCLKVSERVQVNEVRALLMGTTNWMTVGAEQAYEARPLVLEFYSEIIGKGLFPKVIVDYEREPYIYGPGNVRITFDSDIRAGYRCEDFLNTAETAVPAGSPPLLMEVKWDAFLPSVIQEAVRVRRPSASAFSKYTQCRGVL